MQVIVGSFKVFKRLVETELLDVLRKLDTNCLTFMRSKRSSMPNGRNLQVGFCTPNETMQIINHMRLQLTLNEIEIVNQYLSIHIRNFKGAMKNFLIVLKMPLKIVELFATESARGLIAAFIRCLQPYFPRRRADVSAFVLLNRFPTNDRCRIGLI